MVWVFAVDEDEVAVGAGGIDEGVGEAGTLGGELGVDACESGTGDACMLGDACEPSADGLHGGTGDEAHTGADTMENGVVSVAARSSKKSRESSAGLGFSWAKGKMDSSKMTCREVMIRRVDKSRQR
jgi:hypothetical protein